MSEPALMEAYDNLKRDYDSLLKERTGELMDRNSEEVAYEQVFFAVDEQLADLIHNIVKPENNLWNLDNQALIDRFFDIRNQVVDFIVEINQRER